MESLTPSKEWGLLPDCKDSMESSAVWTTCSDSEDDTTRELNEEDGFPSNRYQQDSFCGAGEQSLTKDAHASVDLTFAKEDASTRYGRDSMDSEKAEAGKKAPYKERQDLTCFQKQQGIKRTAPGSVGSTCTVNISEAGGFLDQDSKGFTIQTMPKGDNEEQDLVTQKHLGESAEQLESDSSTSSPPPMTDLTQAVEDIMCTARKRSNNMAQSPGSRPLADSNSENRPGEEDRFWEQALEQMKARGKQWVQKTLGNVAEQKESGQHAIAQRETSKKRSGHNKRQPAWLAHSAQPKRVKERSPTLTSRTLTAAPGDSTTAPVDQQGTFPPTMQQETAQSVGARPQEEKVVWLVGHSLIEKAERRVKATRWKSDFAQANCKVLWFGRPGMPWAALEPTVEVLLRNNPKPDVLVIHLGGNDITSMGRGALIQEIRGSLLRLSDRLGTCKIVWSEIVPRMIWHGAESNAAVDRSRSKLNKEMSKFAASFGFGVIHHSLISPRVHENFLDGVNLADSALDNFIKSISLELRRVGCSRDR